VKNITVSVEDDLYHAARVAAAQQKTNVTAVLRRYLVALVKGEAPLMRDPPEDAERKNRENLARLFREANLVLGYKPTREKTHER